MKKIPLTRGMVALVDDEDYDHLMRFKWYAQRTKRESRNFYATRDVWLGDGRTLKVAMHKSILRAKRHERVDHKNCDSLDNRRSNLRFCSPGQNVANQKLAKNNSSGYRGVSWFRRDNNWTAHIVVDRVAKNLGYFDTPEDAARAWDIAARKAWGEFARLNFPEEGEQGVH